MVSGSFCKVEFGRRPKSIPELQRRHARLAPPCHTFPGSQPASGSSAQLGAGVFQQSYGRPGLTCIQVVENPQCPWWMIATMFIKPIRDLKTISRSSHEPRGYWAFPVSCCCLLLMAWHHTCPGRPCFGLTNIDRRPWHRLVNSHRMMPEVVGKGWTLDLGLSLNGESLIAGLFRRENPIENGWYGGTPIYGNIHI